MTNERHEKALEAACGKHPMHVRPEILEEMFATYLEAMDAVIVPKRPTDEMGRASRIVIDCRGLDVGRVTTWGVNAWDSMLAAAPNHFTNGE
jgi:hypothetical protein